MRVGEYLFRKLKDEGVTHTFGIPGDFALSLYAAQEAVGLPTIVMTHEPSVGYAADVYGRLNGLGVALVTYGVGALNMVNATAMAYAEESPLLVIAGAPEVRWREADVLFHHRVKSPDSQLRVYQEVTAAQASINDPDRAAQEIDRVIETVRRLSRPGFIEIARDVVNLPMPSRSASHPPVAPAISASSRAAMKEAMKEIIVRLNGSKRPVVFAGVEIERFGLMSSLQRLVERINVPVATSLMGKAVMPEHHRNFIGNYFGKLGPKPVRDTLEHADCILALGMLFTDMDTGGGTAKIDRSLLIQATASGTQISHHLYPDVALKEVMRELLRAKNLHPHRFTPPRSVKPPRKSSGPGLTMSGIIEELNDFLRPHHVVVADTGDCLFASVDLRADLFIAPGYYASMGLAVPGAIGAMIARPDLRAVALVGDGAFKMNGVELGTAADIGLNPIVVVINNQSFATLKVALGDRPYLRVRPWDLASIANALGGHGVRVNTRRAFRECLRAAESSSTFYLIDAVIDPDDSSATLIRLGEQLQGKVKRK